MSLSHVNEHGKASMVDVSGKPRIRRTARAFARIALQLETIRLIRENAVRKGDVLAAARIAAIAGAKKTWELIPLCHNISIDKIEVSFSVLDRAVEITGEAVCTDRTGIEMEALTAVSIAALTIYDMCKAVDASMRIEEIRLLEKRKETGGASEF